MSARQWILTEDDIFELPVRRDAVAARLSVHLTLPDLISDTITTDFEESYHACKDYVSALRAARNRSKSRRNVRQTPIDKSIRGQSRLKKSAGKRRSLRAAFTQGQKLPSPLREQFTAYGDSEVDSDQQWTPVPLVHKRVLQLRETAKTSKTVCKSQLNQRTPAALSSSVSVPVPPRVASTKSLDSGSRNKARKEDIQKRLALRKRYLEPPALDDDDAAMKA